ILTDMFTFPGNMPVATDQSTILIATTDAQGFFALVPNLVMMPVLSPRGGKVCFFDPVALGNIDCASWGGYAGDPTGVGTPFNFPVGLVRGSAMQRRLDICGSPTILDGCDDTDDSANDFRSVTPAPRNNAGQPGTIPPSTCGNGARESLEQCDDGNLNTGDGCNATCRHETNAFTPQALIVDPAENGVLEPGETVAVQPSWRNATTASQAMSGTISIFSGPVGGVYTIPDRAASYGTVAPGTTASCMGTGDCYSVSASASTRPSTHWDSTAAEVMSSDG